MLAWASRMLAWVSQMLAWASRMLAWASRMLVLNDVFAIILLYDYDIPWALECLLEEGRLLFKKYDGYCSC